MNPRHAKLLHIATLTFGAAFVIYGIAVLCFQRWYTPGSPEWSAKWLTATLFGSAAVLLALIDREVQAKVRSRHMGKPPSKNADSLERARTDHEAHCEQMQMYRRAWREAYRELERGRALANRSRKRGKGGEE